MAQIYVDRTELTIPKLLRIIGQNPEEYEVWSSDETLPKQEEMEVEFSTTGQFFGYWSQVEAYFDGCGYEMLDAAVGEAYRRKYPTYDRGGVIHFGRTHLLYRPHPWSHDVCLDDDGVGGWKLRLGNQNNQGNGDERFAVRKKMSHQSPG